VVIRTNRGFQIFDPEGDPLTGLMYREPGAILGIHNNRIVTEIQAEHRFATDTTEIYYTKSIPHAYQMMVDLGFDWENPGDDLYLRFGTLVK